MSTAQRLALGGLLGAFLVAILAWSVSRHDAAQQGQRTRPATPRLEIPWSHAHHPVLTGLQGAASTLHLALVEHALPGHITPCYQIVIGGAVTVLRPPLPPVDPLQPPVTTVGIVLPAPLSALDPSERGALIAIAAAASAGLPGTEGPRFVGHGVLLPPDEVERLHRWIRP